MVPVSKLINPTGIYICLKTTCNLGLIISVFKLIAWVQVLKYQELGVCLLCICCTRMYMSCMYLLQALHVNILLYLWQVFLLLRRILLTVFPKPLFGSRHNWNVFTRMLHRLVSLGRFEKVYLGQCMDGIRVGLKMMYTAVPVFYNPLF